MNEPHVTVVKVGGKEIAPGPSVERLTQWIARTTRRGGRLIVVHGGGEEVSERAAALGLPTEKRRGQRVTSAPMLEVVLEVLGGRVNGRLVARLNAAGVPAVGVSGLSGRLLSVALSGDPPGSLGFVGRPTQVRPFLLGTLLDRGFTPVVAPIGIDPHGRLLNVNADLVAGALAKAMRADLRLVTDVPGVKDASGMILGRLSLPEARRLVATGVALDGMIPKLEAAEAALTSSNSVWIGDLDGLVRPVGESGTTLVAARRTAARWPLVLPTRGRAPS